MKRQAAKVGRTDRGPIETKRSAIEYRPIGTVLPDPQNPRIHAREQVGAIARSIEAFGFNAPILIDKSGRVIAGHGRLEAAKLLEMQDIPVIQLEHLSEAQAKAYMLADNKLADRSSWNDEQLARRLKELSEIALDFEIEAMGFEPPEIDLRIQSLEIGDEADVLDGFQESEGPVISRLGDIWSLGPYRLLCGDALNPVAYTSLLGEERAGCVFGDPPFNVPIRGHVGGNGRKKHREFAMAVGEMSSAQFIEFLRTYLGLVRTHSDPGAVCFMCMDWRHCGEAVSAIEQAGFEPLNLCVWAKNNGGMGTLYRSAHELVFVFKARGAKHCNNIQLGRFGRNRTNVWYYPGMNSFARRGTERALDLHPTVKPTAMVVDAILDVSKREDIVLDPFCGSGTTILAAEKAGRRGYGIELDPGYVDVAIMRWQKMTDQVAMHASGKSFEQVRAERSRQGDEGVLSDRHDAEA